MMQCGLGGTAWLSWKIISRPGAAVIKAPRTRSLNQMCILAVQIPPRRPYSFPLAPRKNPSTSPSFRCRPSRLPADPLLFLACGLSQASLVS